MNYFEDLSNPSLGPLIKILKWVSVWRLGRTRIRTIIHFCFMIFCILCLTNIIVNLIVNFNFQLFITFIQYSAFHMCVLKILALTVWFNKWEKAIKTISQIELESRLDKTSHYMPILILYKKYTHIVIFGYSAIGTFINVCFTGGLIINNLVLNEFRSEVYVIHLFYALLPVDESTRSGRFISTILQMLYSETALVFILCWDTLVLSSMIFLIGQLKALRVRCVHTLNNLKIDDNLRNIVKCHKHYLSIIE